MADKIVYRKANVSSAEATKSLFATLPRAELISFVQKKATAAEAAAAGANEGDLVYEATVRLAEFPPKEDGSGPESESAEDPSSPAPPKPEEGGGEDDAPDEEGPEEGGSPFGGDAEGESGEKPKALKGEALTNHLLTELLHAVQKLDPSGGGDPLAGGDLGGGPAGPPGLPDVGAPGAGEGLPAPGGAPLPPPVKEKSPVGGGAFAHYDPTQSQISVLRRDANELGNKAMIAEAAVDFPTHKVERIQRTGAAKINGFQVDLPGSNVAVVTLVRK